MASGPAEALPQRAGTSKGIDEVRPQSPWPTHKNKKQTLGKIAPAYSGNIMLPALNIPMVGVRVSLLGILTPRRRRAAC